jgi:hypothetical protein
MAFANWLAQRMPALTGVKPAFLQDNATCATCIYSHFEGNVDGECRRHAPQPKFGYEIPDDLLDEQFKKEADKWHTYFPMVFEDHFCGDYVEGQTRETEIKKKE